MIDGEIKMKLIKSIVCSTFAGILIAGCATRVKPAPIEAVTQMPSYEQAAAPKPSQPQMSSIAKDKVVVEGASNSQPVVTNPAKQNPPASAPAAVNKAPTPTTSPVVQPPTPATNNSISQQWAKPTNGAVVQGFTPIDKGINYTGQVGQPIYAVNVGKVVYSGNGLKGYGNLIIIKHDNTYLSAYAHNKVNLVREGAIVKGGQVIAKMGTGDNGKALLHFELRQNGKPIDPTTIIK